MKFVFVLLTILFLSSCNAGKHYFNKRINHPDVLTTFGTEDEKTDVKCIAENKPEVHEINTEISTTQIQLIDVKATHKVKDETEVVKKAFSINPVRVITHLTNSQHKIKKNRKSKPALTPKQETSNLFKRILILVSILALLIFIFAGPVYNEALCTIILISLPILFIVYALKDAGFKFKARQKS